LLIKSLNFKFLNQRLYMRVIAAYLIFAILLIVGCKSDTTEPKALTINDLNGEWEIYHATRNGKVTKSLEKGNFVFQDDSLVSSNLFNTANSLNFTYDKGAITIKGEPNFSTLNVESFKEDTLVLSARLKVFEMEFYLLKK